MDGDCIEEHHRCLARVANDHAFHSFENGLSSILVIFQVISLDDWFEDIFVPCLQTAAPAFVILFFLLLILILVFLVTNLFAAVITTAYTALDDDRQDERHTPPCVVAKKKTFAMMMDYSDEAYPGRTTHGSSMSNARRVDMRKGNKAAEEEHVLKVLGTNMAMEEMVKRDHRASRNTAEEDAHASIARKTARRPHLLQTSFLLWEKARRVSMLLQHPSMTLLPRSAASSTMVSIMNRGQSRNGRRHSSVYREILDNDDDDEDEDDTDAEEENAENETTDKEPPDLKPDPALSSSNPHSHAHPHHPHPPRRRRRQHVEDVFEHDIRHAPGLSGRIRRFILSKPFNDTVMACIVINTVALMVNEPTTDPRSFSTSIFEAIEIAFSFVFAVELLLRVYAFQRASIFFLSYERWFDTIVVLTNLMLSVSSSWLCMREISIDIDIERYR
jgi:hypothetical protein